MPTGICIKEFWEKHNYHKCLPVSQVVKLTSLTCSRPFFFSNTNMHPLRWQNLRLQPLPWPRLQRKHWPLFFTRFMSPHPGSPETPLVLLRHYPHLQAVYQQWWQTVTNISTLVISVCSTSCKYFAFTTHDNTISSSDRHVLQIMRLQVTRNWNLVEQSNESHTTLLHGTLWRLLSSVSLGWSSAPSANLEDWWGIKRWTYIDWIDWNYLLIMFGTENIQKCPTQPHKPDITASDGIQASSLMKPARPCHNSPEIKCEMIFFRVPSSQGMFSIIPRHVLSTGIPPNCQVSGDREAQNPYQTVTATQRQILS